MKYQKHNWLILIITSLICSCGALKKTSLLKDDNLLFIDTSAQSYVQMDTSIINHRGMLEMLSTYKISLDKAMNEVVGHTSVPLTKAQPESTLGNLIADAQISAVRQHDPSKNVSISISNQGGIRIPFLASGVITLGKVYEIMPFDNKLVVVEVPGPILTKWCNHIATKGGWPVSGIRFTIKDGIADSIIAQNQLINPQRIYRVVTTDYLANGGDNCDFLKGLKRYNYNLLLRDAIVSYFRANSSRDKPLKITIENRIQYAE